MLCFLSVIERSLAILFSGNGILFKSFAIESGASAGFVCIEGREGTTLFCLFFLTSRQKSTVTNFAGVFYINRFFCFLFFFLKKTRNIYKFFRSLMAFGRNFVSLWVPREKGGWCRRKLNKITAVVCYSFFFFFYIIISASDLFLDCAVDVVIFFFFFLISSSNGSLLLAFFSLSTTQEYYNTTSWKSWIFTLLPPHAVRAVRTLLLSDHKSETPRHHHHHFFSYFLHHQNCPNCLTDCIPPSPEFPRPPVDGSHSKTFRPPTLKRSSHSKLTRVETVALSGVVKPLERGKEAAINLEFRSNPLIWGCEKTVKIPLKGSGRSK